MDRAEGTININRSAPVGKASLAQVADVSISAPGHMYERIAARVSPIAWMALGPATIGAAFAIAATSDREYGVVLTAMLIRVSLCWYLFALLGMAAMTRTDRAAETSLGGTIRWCWTWACAAFVCHVCVAFHYYDRWSHDAAFARVEHESGIGQGIYVSYTFLIVWLADIAAWWLAPRRYAALAVDRSLSTRLHAVHRIQRHDYF
ncbi:MAG: hypothetical protein QM811_09365 [Pirellulales bacterium]